MGEPLLHVMGWVQDCTLVFIPASIFEESLQLLYDVQEARKECLARDEKTQQKIFKKIQKNEKTPSIKRTNNLMKLMSKRELPSEWSTSASTLMSTVRILKDAHRGMPIVVFNSPHHD